VKYQKSNGKSSFHTLNISSLESLANVDHVRSGDFLTGNMFGRKTVIEKIGFRSPMKQASVAGHGAAKTEWFPERRALARGIIIRPGAYT
jgi:hypothetical protein